MCPTTTYRQSNIPSQRYVPRCNRGRDYGSARTSREKDSIRRRNHLSPGNQGPELVGANQTPNPGNQGPELVGAKPSPDNQGPELVGQEPEPTSKDVEVMAGAGYWDIAAASLGYTKGTPTKSIAELRAYVNSHTTQKDKTRIFYLMQQLQKDNHNKVLHPHEKLAVTEQEIEQSENH
ncbi:MAG TPA: hypothetical protein V6C97_26020 [Oculatellaceae cyanobacterium]